ncbi:MAG TPA: amidohydrolase family protein [Planctomycetota bacterium]|nr:amidohydrolase family protein [Planctomycetota bacterium]
MSAIRVRGGLVFDGSGAPGRVQDLFVRDGVVAGPGPVDEEIDATGCWVTPGFVDLHTHYDAEVEVLPSLSESVRHGVTTVVLGSCSLSLAVGRPVDLADMFCRVEAIPRSVVLPLLESRKDWDGPASYLSHLDSLPLGPNVASFLGHSTIRMSAMGVERSLTRDVAPSRREMRRMEYLLDEALDAGYLGMSIQTLPWDKMDGEAFRSRPMPSVFARWSEYGKLAGHLRRRGRVLQGVPDLTTKINVLLFYLMSCGLGRRTLKTTIISLMDVRGDRLSFRIAGWLAQVCNKVLRADFRLQALPEVFDLWADGIDLVVFEEFGAGTAALHLQDMAARSALLRDSGYRDRFKREWRSRFLPKAFHRRLKHCQILACPEGRLIGKTFSEVALERGADEVDVFLDLVAEHGSKLRWFTVMGNDRPDALRWIVSHPSALIGFSDAGAHLRNMAHYNFPLRMLRLVHDAERRGESFMTVGRAVHRLTGEIADWLGIDAGRLAIGKRADLVVVDPLGLDASLDEAHEVEMEGFGLARLVRRNDRAVRAVLINGRPAWRDGRIDSRLGRERGFGSVLRA